MFVSHAERSNFVSSLTDACSAFDHSPALHADWLEPIPTSSWMRFDAIRWPSSAVLARGSPRVLLLNTQRRILNFIKSTDVPAGATVPGNAPVEQMVGLNPGRVLVERSSSDEARVVLCTGSNTISGSLQNRLKTATDGLQIPLQFASHGERERFCAFIAQAVAPVSEQHAALASLGDVAALAVVPSAVAKGSSEAGAEQRSAHSGDGAPEASPAAAGSAAARARQTASTLQAYSNTVGSLYGREWPHQPVSVAVATFNAGGVAPPSGNGSMHDWIPVPHSALLEQNVRSQRGNTVAHRNRTTSQVVHPSKEFDGTTDLYVVGMQELGGQRNRELWSAAVLGHINTSMAMLARSQVPLAKGTSSFDLGSPRPKAGLPTKAASLLDLREQHTARRDSDAADEDAEAPQAASVFRTSRSHTSTTSALAGGRSSSDVPDTHRFVLVASEFMWELGIMVFVRASKARSITGVTTSQKATGLSLVAGKQLGNKGAVGAAFRWNGVQLSFINAHLAARPERIAQRNEHFKAVMAGLDLCTSLRAQALGLTAVSEHTWFLGDLNYRVDLSFDEAHDACKELDFAKLSSADQLLKQMGSNNVLSGFCEGPLEFLPTYRWERSSDFISYKRGQSPSYTDRILHQSLPGVADKLALVEYTSAPQYYGSDHRPVRALYELSLRRQYLPPPPLLTHTLIPFPTFFSRVDSLFGPVPVIQLQALQVSGFSALHAPGVMFLSLYSPGLLQTHDPPACSAAVPATGVSAEQASQLVLLKSSLQKEEKERRTATKRAMKMKEASEKAMHKARAAELKASRTTPLGHMEGAAAEAFQRPHAESVDGELSESEDDDVAADGTALPFDGVAVSQGTAMARSDSMSVLDPHRLSLLSLACQYDFPDGVAPVCPALWDPRVLSSAHVIVAAHRAVISRDGQVASGDDVDHPIIASAAVPLRAVVDAAATAVTMSSMAGAAAATRSSAQLPGRHRNSTMQVTSFAKTFDEHGVPLPLRCEAVPFSVPLVKDGIKVAQLSGKVALRASTQPGVREFLVQQDGSGQQWLGSETHFADSLKSLVSLMDDMQDAMLSPASATIAAAARPASHTPARVVSTSSTLAPVEEDAPHLDALVGSDISAEDGIEAPTRRASVDRRGPAAAGAGRRPSKRGSILALHQPARDATTGAITPMSRLASTAMLSPAMPASSRMAASPQRSHSRTASVARPASKSATIAASSGDSQQAGSSSYKALHQPMQTRRTGSVARRSLAIPSSINLARSAVTLPSDREPEPTADSALAVGDERTPSALSEASSDSHASAPSGSATPDKASPSPTLSPTPAGPSLPPPPASKLPPASAAGREPASDARASPPPNKPKHTAKLAPGTAKVAVFASQLPPPPATRPPLSEQPAAGDQPAKNAATTGAVRVTSPEAEAGAVTGTPSALGGARQHSRGTLKLPAPAPVAAASASASSADSPVSQTPSPHSETDTDSLVLPSGRTRRLAGKKIVRTSGKPVPPSALPPPALPAFAKRALPPPKPKPPSTKGPGDN